MSATILIADDDYDNRAILRQALEASGFRVLEAVNGEEALQAVQAQSPDLILLDLSMPKMNGWEAAKRLRQLPQAAAVPIFAFTAHALQGDEVKARAAGCDDYVSKPCIPREVVEKIRRRLAQKEQAHG